MRSKNDEKNEKKIDKFWTFNLMNVVKKGRFLKESSKSVFTRCYFFRKCLLRELLLGNVPETHCLQDNLYLMKFVFPQKAFLRLGLEKRLSFYLSDYKWVEIERSIDYLWNILTKKNPVFAVSLENAPVFKEQREWPVAFLGCQCSTGLFRRW